MWKILCKNILALYRYGDFCVKIFYFASPCTLSDITQKMKRDTDERKQRLIDTWGRISQGIIDKAIDQWQTRLCACVKARGRHFECLV